MNWKFWQKKRQDPQPPKPSKKIRFAIECDLDGNVDTSATYPASSSPEEQKAITKWYAITAFALARGRLIDKLVARIVLDGEEANANPVSRDASRMLKGMLEEIRRDPGVIVPGPMEVFRPLRRERE